MEALVKVKSSGLTVRKADPLLFYASAALRNLLNVPGLSKWIITSEMIL